ncbi:MAG: YjbH domain-containing protein [Rhodobacterales bacterium]
MTKKFICGTVSMLLAMAPLPIYAQSTFTTTINMYGAPGLIDMPTAEMMPDAELTVTTSNFGKAQKTTLTFQILPRITGSFRYTKIKGLNPPAAALGGDIFDRSFDIAYQVLTRERSFADVTVGLRDFMGTGIYAGEYIVGTTSLTPKLKITGGVGWGRFSDSNKLHSNSTSTGGVPNANAWFRGPRGYFGGLEWQTPYKRLILKAEYSSDQYALETRTALGSPAIPPLFNRKSHINFGLDYKLGKRFSLGVYYMYGSELGIKLNTSINPKHPRITATLGPAPYAIQRREDGANFSPNWASQKTANKALRKALDAFLAPQGIRVDGLLLKGTYAELRIRNNRYNVPAQAIGRTARAMANTLPASVETFIITPMEQGIPAVSVKLDRSTLEKNEFNLNGSEAILANAEIYGAPQFPEGMQLIDNYYPKFTWSFSPFIDASLFDPVEPVRAELALRLKGKVTLRPGLSFTGSITKNIFGNNGRGTISASKLPKVRSEASLFREFGDPGIENLKADYLFKASPDVYGRVSAGYLEDMYAGVSTELLWKPVQQKWGVGAEINYVKQRAYNQLFGFRNYSVATGYVSAYYDFNNGFSAQVDVGRYLARDVGSTVSINRRFPNGWSIGAYATITNASFADFGEGSFDKGINLTIPLKPLIGTQTRAVASQRLSSLTRDGGARLDIPNRLYPAVRDLHKKNLVAGWGGFLR